MVQSNRSKAHRRAARNNKGQGRIGHTRCGARNNAADVADEHGSIVWYSDVATGQQSLQGWEEREVVPRESCLLQDGVLACVIMIPVAVAL